MFAEIERQELDARAFGKAKIAAIGPGTAAALKSRGARADVMAKEFRGEGLAEALLSSPRTTPFRVLIPRALVAREALPETLRAAGAEVDVVPAYMTVTPDSKTIAPLREALSRNEIDLITLTSSSTVEHLVEMLGSDANELLSKVTLASIGPITTATAEKSFEGRDHSDGVFDPRALGGNGARLCIARSCRIAALMNHTQHADVIVLGAGHNALVCAVMLAKAGLDVLVLEAKNQVGGAFVKTERPL
ncbi:MAG: uroporphyrinogen-III synthase [Polyangiaceae bacterium]